jgi:hypothetical protein
LISLCRISTTSVCHNSQWGSQLPLQSSHDSSDLQDTSSSARTSLQGRVCKMSGLWQNQCHNKISTVGTRCTTWCHKLCVSMTASVCTTAILTFKIAWVILSHFLQKYGRHYVRTSSATSANC